LIGARVKTGDEGGLVATSLISSDNGPSPSSLKADILNL